MANKILILGSSGSGKSASIRNLDPQENFVFKCIPKDLPFKGSRSKYSIEKKNTYTTNKPKELIAALKKVQKNKKIKTIILDDVNYVMTYEYKRKAAENGFQKFEDIAFDFMRLLECIDNLRDDLNVYLMAHTEKDQDGELTIKTIGKFLAEKVKIEGLFTITLLATGATDDYQFVTNGVIPAKSPMGMFENNLLENDLTIVNQRVNEYYN